MIMKSAFFSLILWICTYNSSFGATIYVDNTIGSNCSGNYSISERDCSGSDGDAYTTIQAALDNMSKGDTIYMRGGTYQEGTIHIPTSPNGTAWTEGNFNTIASYPGEWAIIDGQNNTDATYGGMGIGSHGYSSYGYELNYWVFERFEIKNCKPSSDNKGTGLWVGGGPVKIGYMYIHDNGVDVSCQDNPSGLTAYRLENSIIEYNYFKDNATGCSSNNTNGAQIQWFSDYHTEQQDGTTDLVDINHAIRQNIIRYNLFDSTTYYGIKGKPAQLLGPDNATDPTIGTYKEYGDKFHHNIFLNHNTAVALRQDYQQFYNNIIAGGSSLDLDQYNSFARLWITVYNNTILTGQIKHWSQNDQTFIPRDYIYNNILDYSPAGSSSTNRPISIWPYSDADSCGTDYSDIDKNYLYRPQSSSNQVVWSMNDGCGSQYGYRTLAQFNSDHGKNNYTKSSSEGSDKLMKDSSGADKYKTRGAHVVSGSINISNGGKGGSHPYLPGVALPSYLGAINPNGGDSGLNWSPNNPDPDDSGWVDYILSLSDITDINTLKSGGYIGISPLPPKELKMIN